MLRESVGGRSLLEPVLFVLRIFQLRTPYGCPSHGDPYDVTCIITVFIKF